MTRDLKNILFTFDTTGSMYPCLTQVRQNIEQTIRQLFQGIENLSIAIIAHGDYCDGGRALTSMDFTTNVEGIVKFVKTVPATGGGDAPECYEAVLNAARGLSWFPSADKAMVLIGDEVPHVKGERKERGGIVEFDWRNEARFLRGSGITLYPLQALGRSHAHRFYDELSVMFGTPHLELDQFADVTDILNAVSYKQAGQLIDFEIQLAKRGTKPSPGVRRTLDQLAGRAENLSKRTVATGGRFQVIEVPSDSSIREFVQSQGLEFGKGRGFYEFGKSETIQEYKEVVAQNIDSGAIIIGKRARSVLGVGEETGRYKPSSETHRGFVQSTSVNRKLISGTKFLYEINETAGL